MKIINTSSICSLQLTGLSKNCSAKKVCLLTNIKKSKEIVSKEEPEIIYRPEISSFHLNSGSFTKRGIQL